MQGTANDARRQPTRAERLKGFDELPGDALIDVATLAALRDRSESKTWEDLKRDPHAPQTLKITKRCTRVRVADARRWVSGVAK